MAELTLPCNCLLDVEFDKSGKNDRHPERTSRVRGEVWLCDLHTQQFEMEHPPSTI